MVERTWRTHASSWWCLTESCSANCRTIRTEGHSFLDPYRRHTLRFEQAVADLCRVLPIQHVAERFGLSWHAVKEIDKRRPQQEVGTPCYRQAPAPGGG